MWDLSGAAEPLHLSQPALNRSMQRLEDELQVPLFDRQKNKIEFNENGRMAADHPDWILCPGSPLGNSATVSIS